MWAWDEALNMNKVHKEASFISPLLVSMSQQLPASWARVIVLDGTKAQWARRSWVYVSWQVKAQIPGGFPQTALRTPCLQPGNWAHRLHTWCSGDSRMWAQQVRWRSKRVRKIYGRRKGFFEKCVTALLFLKFCQEMWKKGEIGGKKKSCSQWYQQVKNYKNYKKKRKEKTTKKKKSSWLFLFLFADVCEGRTWRRQ